jgi:hypothetical protein
MLEEYAKKFKELHRKETGEELSNQKALESFQKLAEVLKFVYKRIPKNDFERLDTS